ncbi:unnamed protein product [Coccothraustes coccothraustes]
MRAEKGRGAWKHLYPQQRLPPGACAIAAARQRYGRGLGAPLRARPLTDGLELVADGPGAGDAREQGERPPPPHLPGQPLLGHAWSPAAPRPPCPGPSASGPASPAVRVPGRACTAKLWSACCYLFYCIFKKKEKKKSSRDGVVFLVAPLHKNFAFVSSGTRLYVL